MSYIKRDYRIKFRLCLREDLNSNSHNYNKYYMPKWANFMKAIMSRKLTNSNQSKTCSFSELPLLRKVVNKDIKTEIVAPLLGTYDEKLTRNLLEIAPLFDIAPSDLKCHIFAVFGVTASALEEYLDRNNY